MYGLAIDLGTTTLAASLVDCSSGGRLAISGALNPQRRFGADVISRLDAAVNSAPLQREMSVLIRTELRRMGEELCDATGIAWGDLQQVAIAGNPAMQHILIGLDLASLAFPPYRPLHTGGTQLTAPDLEWDGNADIYLFPMPGGFVGGDTVAFVYGAEPGEETLCLETAGGVEQEGLAEGGFEFAPTEDFSGGAGDSVGGGHEGDQRFSTLAGGDVYGEYGEKRCGKGGRVLKE